MKWLYKLENKFGRYYIPRLMTVIVAGMALVFLLDTFAAAGGASFSALLTLNRAAIFQGQIWRLITFIFVPSSSGIWLILYLYIYYSMGNMLEQYWGSFRLNVYYLCGMLGAIATCLITGSASNYYLNLSLILAFATIQPDATFMLFFIIPFKAKWLLIAYAVLTLANVLGTLLYSPMAALFMLVALAFSLINYFLFFGGTLFREIRDQIQIAKNRRNWHNNWKN